MQRSLLASFLLLAACGGGSMSGDDDGGGDDSPVGDRRGTVAVVAGDFDATGLISTVTFDGTVSADAAPGTVGADPALRRIGDELFVINRFGTGGNNITILSASDLQLIDQIGTGEGSNPQDVAMVGTKLYIPALGSGALLVIDRNTPDTIDTIDLSALDDDGVPDCISAAALDGKVYVACGLLDSFAAVENGVVAVIDPATDTLEDTIELPAKNPTGWFTEVDGALLLATVPDYVDYSTGCVARITGDGADCAVDNAALGGYANRLLYADGQAWAVVAAFDADFDSSGWLVRFDGGFTPSAALTPETAVIQDAALCGGHVFAADKAFDADGIRIYTAGGVREETDGALDVGLPPVYGNAIACTAP